MQAGHMAENRTTKACVQVRTRWLRRGHFAQESATQQSRLLRCKAYPYARSSCRVYLAAICASSVESRRPVAWAVCSRLTNIHNYKPAPLYGFGSLTVFLVPVRMLMVFTRQGCMAKCAANGYYDTML